MGSYRSDGFSYKYHGSAKAISHSLDLEGFFFVLRLLRGGWNSHSSTIENIMEKVFKRDEQKNTKSAARPETPKP